MHQMARRRSPWPSTWDNLCGRSLMPKAHKPPLQFLLTIKIASTAPSQFQVCSHENGATFLSIIQGTLPSLTWETWSSSSLPLLQKCTNSTNQPNRQWLASCSSTRANSHQHEQRESCSFLSLPRKKQERDPSVPTAASTQSWSLRCHPNQS